jgi:transposase
LIPHSSVNALSCRREEEEEEEEEETGFRVSLYIHSFRLD